MSVRSRPRHTYTPLKTRIRLISRLRCRIWHEAAFATDRDRCRVLAHRYYWLQVIRDRMRGSLPLSPDHW